MHNIIILKGETGTIQQVTKRVPNHDSIEIYVPAKYVNDFVDAGAPIYAKKMHNQTYYLTNVRVQDLIKIAQVL